MNRRKVLISISIIITMIVLSLIVYATNSALNNEKNYAVTVVDDGTTKKAQDDNLEFQTKIVEEGATDITVETTVKNLIEAKNKEVAIVIDSSYSMGVNSEEYQSEQTNANNQIVTIDGIKQKAIEISNAILDEIENANITIVDNGSVRTSRQTNRNNISNAINGITYNSTNDFSVAIENAKNNYTKNNNNIQKYMIIISDATDSVSENLNDASSKGIKVYSILTDITSTSFGNEQAPVPEDGTVYLMSTFNTQNIVDDLNKTIKDVTLIGTFDEKISTNFYLEGLEENIDGTVTEENNKLKWELETLKAGETKTIRYKLKLNNKKTIGSETLYKDINVFDNTKVEYKAPGITNKVTLENNEVTPTIQIVDAYSLIIHAYGEGTEMPAPGVKFNVEGVDENGVTVISQRDLEADEDGNVEIKTIKPLGTITYTITPVIENLIAYDYSDVQTVSINNRYTAESGGEFIVSYSAGDVITDNTDGHRKVTVPFPIKLHKFTFRVNVTDLSDPDCKIPGVDYRLIQPKVDNKFEMEALYGTTDDNGDIFFNAAVMSKPGTYEYILSQMSEKDGYENVGNATIRVTFDSNGKIVENGVKTLYNNLVSGKRINEDYALINVSEKCNSSNSFNLKIHLEDEQTHDAIEGTIYKIIVKKIGSSNSGNDEMTYTKLTDENGEISFKAIGTESGYTQIILHEEQSNDNYITNPNKEIIINRQGGIISEITTGGDYTIRDPNNNNGIIANLTSRKKQELNIVRMHLTQKDDTDLNLINVPMRLKDITPNGAHNGQEYLATTDVNGYANFTLEDPATIADGTYYFQVEVSEIPIGFFEPDAVGKIKVSILDGRISEITDVTETAANMPIDGANTFVENEDTTISNIAFANYALEPDLANTSYLKIKLQDKDSGDPIVNGKYEITMERDGGQIANAGSTGKYTRQNGFTPKMSIPGLDSNPVTITISQKYDSSKQNGYKVDPRTYVIVVHKENDGNVQVDNIELLDGTHIEENMFTFEDGNNDSLMDTIVFNHVNEKINPGDVLLNLAIAKYDWTTKEPCQIQNIKIWSDDFDIYNKETYQYEQFDRNNPYNPFITGNIDTIGDAMSSKPVTMSSSIGQVDIKLKPINLPEVMEPDRDGYPTGTAELHIGEWDSSNNCIVAGTEYAISINFTYSKETGTYKLTGCSNLTNWSLLKKFHHSTSLNSADGYEETAVLELWSNYGQTANFGIDFSKYNYEDQELPGAKYSVKLILPTGAFVELAQNVINGDNSVEIPDIFVKEGAILTIQELEAPIGYELDTQPASFKITSINETTGIITIEPDGVQNERITLGTSKIATTPDGNPKFIQNIKLIDLEMNNTKFGITSKDKDTKDPTQGNTYKFLASTGGTAISGATDESGNVTTLIGSEKKDAYMEYTINQKLQDGTSVARYYKRLPNDIKVKVYYDHNGNIVNDPSDPNYYGKLCRDIDNNYGQTWYIDSVNGDNRINIVILQEREDPLTIDFDTRDEFTNAELTGLVRYEVTPTVVLDGLENYTKETQVGYVVPGETITYNVKAIVDEKYIGIPDQKFIVTYDEEGLVAQVTPSPESTKLVSTEKTGDQKVKITTKVEPAVPFAIYNTDYFTGAKLQNAEFEIERIDKVKAINKTTDSNGNAVLYDGEFGKGDGSGNQRYIYNVKQNTAAYTYATVEEFKIYVEYNSNREIVSAGVYGEGTASTNKFIDIHKHATCSAGDVGYNGNNKGIVDIEVKNYPAFNIEITDVDRINNSKKLQGAKFEIVSSIDRYPTDESDPKEKIRATTNGTDVNGMEMAYVDRTLFGQTVTYEIINTESAHEYQKTKNIKIEVDFDENGYVNINGVNPVRIIEGSDYAEVQLYNPATSNAENFGIKLTIKSSPEFRINIDNIDRAEYNNGNIVNLAGAEYSITSDYNTSADIVKTTTDTVVAMLQETPINGYATYTIKETKPAVGYQTIEKDIIMKVHFDSNGCIDDVVFTDSKNNAYAQVNRMTEVLDTVDTYKNFAVDLCIRNNPLIALNLNKIAEEDEIPLSNVEFNIKARVKNTEEVIFEQDVTTLSGIGAFKLDRALDNTTIVYTIKETKNTPGYEYRPELTLEVTYDNLGKVIANETKLTPEVDWAQITNTSDYGIDLRVTNKRITDIGINLITVDAYDNTKKAEKAEIKAYFTTDNATFDEDENHSTTLITGRDDNNDGKPDRKHGNDYQLLGKAENISKNQIEGMETATLVLKEVKTPDTYFDEINNNSKDNIYMSWNEVYGLNSARIDMQFTDEGKIIEDSVRIITDSTGSTPLGKLLDKQYLTCNVDPQNPYVLNITLKYYPMLEMTINAVSDSSYDRAQDKEDNDLIGTYRIRSQHYRDVVGSIYGPDSNKKNGLVMAGYVGTSSLGGIVPNPITQDSKIRDNETNEYKANNFALWPGEQYDTSNTVDVGNNGRIRYIYISEPNNENKSEPDNNYDGYNQLKYQQHGQQDYSPQYMSYNNALISAIQVRYNEKGEIVEAKKLTDKGALSRSRAQESDVQSYYQEDYYNVEISDNKHGIIVTPEYKRTTTITANVVDNITGAELNNITLTPFKGETVKTNDNYTYDTHKTRNLANGNNTWTYWGGNSANGSNRYVIGAQFNNGTQYNGYEEIGNVELDIHYDKYGYVDLENSKVLSKNSDGNPNAEIVNVNKDKIELRIIASRKFDIQLDKKDKHDRTKELKNAIFNITSIINNNNNNNENVTESYEILEGRKQKAGLMQRNKTVTYTLTETNTPDRFYTLNPFDLAVTYDNNGVITKIEYKNNNVTKVIYDDIFGARENADIPIKVISVAERFNELKPQNTVDLRFELYDEPKFETEITVKDQFYREETIQGVTFSIENTTYNVQADGSPITDENGHLKTSVGTVHPGETVRYTIKQTNTIVGYHPKNSDIVMDVTFNDNGYVSNYNVVQGNDDQTVIKLDTEKRGFNIIIYNKPKDFKIGIEKYDQLTGDKLAEVKFQISKEVVNSSTVIDPFEPDTTSEYGDITRIVDTFDTEKEIIYTISEIQQLPAYRKIEDIVIRVRYNIDGSIDYYNVDSNPSNVGIKFANKKFETLANGEKVHVMLSVPNDDTYDLIVRDEDKNISNLGINGTVYDISINGRNLANENPPVQENARKTNSNGYMSIVNRKENGNINIKVSEAQIGTGYRENLSNSADLVFIKGTDTYSLELDKQDAINKGYTCQDPVNVYDTNYKDGKLYTIGLGNNTEVLIGVYQGTGKIVYTFKNESKQMINLRKIDAESGNTLEGAEFEIKAQEVDSFGNEQGEATVLTSSLITDDEGMAYLDTGIRPVSKKIKYTFREITPPPTYIGIEDVSIICTYNESGKMVNKEAKSKRIGSDDSWYDLNVSIKNGNISTYSVKIISLDSRKGSTSENATKNRINDSVFDIRIKNSNENIIKERLDATTGRVQDSFGYEEDGVIVINGLQTEGTVTVELQQKVIAEGFIEGDNQVAGTVTFENQFLTAANNLKEPSLSNLNNGGFIDSYIDTNENQIVIKVYNDPIVKLNVHKEDTLKYEPVEGATFTITSEIDGRNRVASTPTSLNVTSTGTDEKGNEAIVIGAPEYGKTVIYTIHENDLADYKEIEDTRIKVTYDSNGKVNNWEVLGDEKYVYVKDKIIYVDGEGEDWTDYKQEDFESLASEENNEVIETQGSRKINTVIRNIPEDKEIPYTIIIEPHNEAGLPVEGIKLDFKLKQDKGGNPSYPAKTTDANGQVTYNAKGSDRLEMEINIINSEVYTFNTDLRFTAYKNSTTGIIESRNSDNIDCEIDNENHILKLIIAAQQTDNEYGISLVKLDKSTHSTIVNNPATFTITRVEKIDNSDEIVEIPEEAQDSDEIIDYSTTQESETAETGEIEYIIANNIITNNNGIVSISKLPMPEVTLSMSEEERTFTYRVYEDKAPDGYKPLGEPVEIKVTYQIEEHGSTIISKVESKDVNKIRASTQKVKGKEDEVLKNGYILYVNNVEDVPQTEVMLNIFKVDEETEEKLNGAIFKVKLADENETWVYTESGENTENEGQLDYCYIEQGKDYEVRLKHMPRPTLEEVKEAPNGILEHVYTFQEIAAPEGYELIKTEFNLTIKYEVKINEDGTESVVIKSVETDNTDLLDIYSIEEDQIGANILNRKENAKVQGYEVVYNKNTEDRVQNLVEKQIKIPEMALTLETSKPEREGYTFSKWCTIPNPTDEEPGETYYPGDKYEKDENVTLYAIWETAKYTITYNGNAPIDSNTGVAVGIVDRIPENQEKNHNEDITIDDQGVVPTIPNVSDYYRFTGWNTKANGTGTHYEIGDAYSENRDLELYAEWNYVIQYKENIPISKDGLPVTSAQNIPDTQEASVLSIENIIIDDTNPEHQVYYDDIPMAEGYVFKEWNTMPDGTGTVYMPNTEYTERKGMILYAIWEYEVTYDKNIPKDETGLPIQAQVDNMPETTRCGLDIDAVIPETVPTIDPDDYEFVGWNTEPDGTGDTYNPGDTYTEHTGITLYAIWEETSIFLRTTNDDYMITNATVSEHPKIKSKVNVNYSTNDYYEYNSGDKYLMGILPSATKIINSRTSEYAKGTTLNELKSYLETNGQIKVYKDIDNDAVLNISIDKEITDENLVGTGMFLYITKGNKKIILQLIVRGDVVSPRGTEPDGNCWTNDVNATKIFVEGDHDGLKEIQKLAMNINMDNTINSQDKIMMSNVVFTWCKYIIIKKSHDIYYATNGGTVKDTKNNIIEKTTYFEGLPYMYNLTKTEKMPSTVENNFEGWYTDANLTNKVNANDIVDSSVTTLYAKWK